MKRTLKNWLGMLVVLGVALIVSAVCFLFCHNWNVATIIRTILIVGVPYICGLAYFHKPKRVDGISREVLIEESCKAIKIQDIEGVCTEDIKKAQLKLEEYKRVNNFTFIGDTFYDSLVVTYVDDAKSELNVERIVNTRKFIVEGKIEKVKDRYRIDGVTLNLPEDSVYALPLRALSFEDIRDNIYHLEYVRPIVYNSDLTGIQKEDKEKYGVPDVITKVIKIEGER